MFHPERYSPDQKKLIIYKRFLRYNAFRFLAAGKEVEYLKNKYK